MGKLPTAQDIMQRELDTDTIALEIAKNQCGAKIPAEDLIMRLGLTDSEFIDLTSNKLFKQKVAGFVKELEESGMSFRMKAHILAEDLLKSQYRLLKDPDTPASVVVNGVANIVRWAGLEKKADGGTADAAGGNRISVNISLDPNTQAVTTAPSITIENGETDETPSRTNTSSDTP